MSKRPRKKIEIYFVLYLAALILLLPDKEDFTDQPRPAKAPGADVSFALQPEKSALFCEMALDTSGSRVLSIDSANTIYYRGKYPNVRFEFVIDDPRANQRFRLTSRRNPTTRFFRIEEIPGRNAAVFYWKPPENIYTNRSYLVTVKAIAEPTAGAPLPAEPVVTEAKFSLNIYFPGGRYLPEQYAMRSDSLNMIADTAAIISNAGNAERSLGDFTIVPEEANLKAIAYQRWRNLIHAYGLNLETDLATMPRVEYDLSHPNNGGSARMAEYTKNAVIVTGIAPSFGSMTVRVSVTRRDGREASTEFNVLPQTLSSPEYERVMYPGREYRIDPNLPLLSGQQTRALLTENGQTRAVSREGQPFDFTPSIVDTGKVLYLELYVNDSLFDVKYPIQVNNYPAPEILRIHSTGSTTVRIKSQSYGLHYGSENYIKKLEAKGNAKVRELFGLLEEDKRNLIYVQYFEITPASPDKPFEFRVRAVDQRGKASQWREYSAR
ncbi:MAG: hypothetical protein ACOCX7_01205 [Bacteroidota bacterium]